MSADETSAVIDASLAIKWIIDEEGTKAAVALRDRWHKNGTLLHAPEFLLVELHNIVWKKLYRGLIAPNAPIIGQTPNFGLTLNWSLTQPLLTSAFLIGIQYQISVYDGLYAALSQSLSAPLYTADQALATKLQGSLIRVQVVAHA